MYYEDGKLKYDLPYKNGILDGVVKKYYGNGKIKSKTLYKNGIEEETNKIAKDTRRTCVQTYISGGLRFTSSANHRTVSIAHENDELQSKDGYEGGYNEPVEDGIHSVYYKTGELGRETPYKGGEKDGICKIYYPNKKLKATIPYIDDKKNGIAKTYYKTGELQSELTFKNDKSIKGFTYDKDGNKTKIANLYFNQNQ